MGKNLKMKAARAALGLTQQDLAEAVGVTRQTIVAIERGTTTPPSSSAWKSARPWVRPWTSCSGNRERSCAP